MFGFSNLYAYICRESTYVFYFYTVIINSNSDRSARRMVLPVTKSVDKSHLYQDLLVFYDVIFPLPQVSMPSVLLLPVAAYYLHYIIHSSVYSRSVRDWLHKR